jgi:hypothetical protein
VQDALDTDLTIAGNYTITGDWIFNGSVTGTGMDAYAALADAETITAAWTFDIAAGGDITLGTDTRLRLLETGDASLASTTHALQIGTTAGQNLIIDNNEIISRNNGAAETLFLQATGGDLFVFGTGTGELSVRSGNVFKIESATNGDEVAMSHDDTDFNTVFTATTDWNLTGLTNITLPDSSGIAFGTSQDAVLSYDGNSLDFTMLAADDQINMTNGAQLRLWESTDTNYLQITNDGNEGVISLDSAGSIRITPQATAARSGITVAETALVTDDSTTTVDFQGLDGGFCFIVASSTANAESAEEGAFFYWTTTTVFEINSSTIWSIGAGTNPDVDGNHNVWRSADGVLSIKNRRAASRYYSVYNFAGA